MLLDPSPCHKLSQLLGPRPLERDVLYGRLPVREKNVVLREPKEALGSPANKVDRPTCG